MTSTRTVTSAAAVLTGLLAIVASGLVPDAPSTAVGSDQEVAEYFAAHMQALQWSVALWSLAAVGLLAFASYAPTLLDGTPAHRALRRLTTAAGACAASIMLTSQATLAVAVREDFSAADATVRRTVFVLTDVLSNTLDLMLPAIGVLIGSLAILALRRLILPRWLGWFGMSGLHLRHPGRPRPDPRRDHRHLRNPRSRWVPALATVDDQRRHHPRRPCTHHARSQNSRSTPRLTQPVATVQHQRPDRGALSARPSGP